MGHVKLYEEFLNESRSSDLIRSLFQTYETPTSTKQILGSVNGIKVISVDRADLSTERPEWTEYIGSHHWGKGTDYIPEDEIWISQGLSREDFIRVVNHELIEREAMRALRDEKGLTSEEAWKIAHHWIKSIGF